MRVVVDILLLLPAFAWQSALAGHFQVRGVGLDLLAVMLASISLNQGWLYGAIGGLICGVMMDSVFGMTGFTPCNTWRWVWPWVLRAKSSAWATGSGRWRRFCGLCAERIGARDLSLLCRCAGEMELCAV